MCLFRSRKQSMPEKLKSEQKEDSIVRKWDEGGLVKDEHRRWYAKRKTEIVMCARRLRAENEQIYSKSVR